MAVAIRTTTPAAIGQAAMQGREANVAFDKSNPEIA
jgi:hypothetical protein